MAVGMVVGVGLGVPACLRAWPLLVGRAPGTRWWSRRRRARVGGRRGGDIVGVAGRGRAPAPDEGQRPEQGQDDHRHHHRGPPTRTAVHGVEGVPLGPIGPGHRRCPGPRAVGRARCGRGRRRRRGSRHRRAVPRPPPPTPASPGSFSARRPPSGPTTLTEDWPDRAEMCSMVPNAEWYCRTEFRSLPRGRRSTETAATTVTTSTTTIRAAHIASIQPDAAGGRASRLRNGR